MSQAGVTSISGAIGFPITVPNGGTGATSFIPYAVITGGTTSTNPLQSVASVGTAGQVLTSNGAGSLPSFQNGAVLSVSGTPNRITSTGGANPVIDIAATYVGQASITTLGTITTGVWNGSIVTVPFGGTGAGAFTGNSLLLGNSASPITALGAATDGQLPIGSTGLPPVLATLTAGSGVSIANAAGSITINALGGGLTWTVVAGAAQAGAVNNGYIANNAGLCTVTLPAVSAVGDIMAVTGINNATGWRVAQNAGNTIFFGTATTTPGVGGSLSSAATRDTVYLLCVTANADWNVVNSIGNITVV